MTTAAVNLWIPGADHGDIENVSPRLIPPTQRFRMSQADSANNQRAVFPYLRTGSPVAFRYFVNANGVAQEVAWLLGAQRFCFLYLLTPCSVPVVRPDAVFLMQGQYVGGIDSTGA
jgi:hypothetical protein